MERFLKTKAPDYRKKKKSNIDTVGTYKIQSVSLMFAFVCVSICPCIHDVSRQLTEFPFTMWDPLEGSGLMESTFARCRILPDMNLYLSNAQS